MTRRQNPPLPRSEFALLLVEGGDEVAICQILAGQTRGPLCCWKADGRDLPGLAQLAKNDASFRHARSVGVVLDAEHDLAAARELAHDTLSVLGATGPLAHAVLTGASPQIGVFLTPDGASRGAIETLCRRAVKNRELAACVDQLVSCAGAPHAAHGNPQVAEDKGWLRAYLGMIEDPTLRLHQAFERQDGIDAEHPAFAPLRAFLRAL